MASFVDPSTNELVDVDAYGNIRRSQAPSAPGGMDLSTALAGADVWNNLKQGTRKAGDAIADVFTSKNAQGLRQARWGRLAGLGTLAAVLGAASEMADTNESAGRNLTQAVGSGGGSLAGGGLGAVIGQALIPVPGLGAIVGGTIGSVLGGGAGHGLASALADAVEGSPEDRALRLAQKQADAQLAMDVKRAQTMLPIQNMASEMSLQSDRKRAEMAAQIQAKQMIQQTLANALIAQQQAGANQQALLTQSILG